MPDIILRNARIVLPEEVVHGSVRLRDGLIVDVSADGASAGEGEDLGGDVLMPGIVELHTDQVEEHYQPRPGRFWDPVPAVVSHDAQMAASGVTTVFDALRIGSGPGDVALSENAAQLVDAVVHAAEAGILRADHFVHLRCEVSTPDVLEAFEQVGGHERVRLVSLMDHTPGQRQYADVEMFRKYMVGKRRLNESEFDAHVARLRELSERYSDANRVALSDLARERGLTLAAHDDATPDHVAESTDLGVRLSEFPTTVTAARAARESGQLVVMGAPNIVRGGSHSGNVAAGELLRDGLLDILSSDYVPASPLQAAFLLVGDGRITLPEAAALVSSNPARAIGLDDRGVIEPGRRADLVRVEVHSELDSPLPIVRGVWSEGRRVA